MDGIVGHRKLGFGPFELSVCERLLRRDGRVLSLGDRALDILIYLAHHPGEIVAKHKLMEHVWSGVNVEEGSLRVHVAAIRKALGDGQFGDRYIATIKGRGYSFVGTVVQLEDQDSPAFRESLVAEPLVLIGREAAMSELRKWIWQGRFVVLLGSGGIDKTTDVTTGHGADVKLISALVHALKTRR